MRRSAGAIACESWRWFGSARRADFGADSDIDLLVEFEADARIGFMVLSRMQRELTALLGRRVDLAPKGGLKPLIRQAVWMTQWCGMRRDEL